jgi:hypothetical protein
MQKRGQRANEVPLPHVAAVPIVECHDVRERPAIAPFGNDLKARVPSALKMSAIRLAIKDYFAVQQLWADA